MTCARRCERSALGLVLVGIVGASPSVAVELSELWPNADGNDWTYTLAYESGTSTFDGTARLYLDGTDTMDGAVVQRLYGDTFPAPSAATNVPALGGFWRALWLARPDLRADVEVRAPRGVWPLTLLGPADGFASDLVGFLETETRIGVWRDALADWSWWWLTDDLSVGASFMLQLIPDLADDVFLTGTVRTQNGVVMTPAERFASALIVDYVIDYGETIVTSDDGTPIGTVESATEGWVAFVSEVGPVAVEETLSFDLGGCATCDPSDFPMFHGEMRLTSGDTPARVTSWGVVKERFAVDSAAE